LELPFVEWARGGWPILVAPLEEGDAERLSALLAGYGSAGLRLPLLAVVGPGASPEAAMTAGAADVARWPQDAEVLCLRVELLEARWAGEPDVCRQISGVAEGAVYAYDLIRGALIWISPNARPVLGFDAAEMLSASPEHLVQLLHPEDALQFERRWRGEGDPGAEDLARSEYRIRADLGWRWVHIRRVPLVRRADGAVELMAGVAMDVTAARAPEEALRTLLRGTSEVGAAFFAALAREVARFLGVRRVVVGEIVRAEGELLRSQAYWADGAFHTPIEFSIPGSACEEAGHGREVHHPTGAGELFPNDPMIARHAVDGFFAVPIPDHDGAPCGILAACHDGRVDLSPTARSVLHTLAQRAGAEIERARWDGALRIQEERFRLATRAAGMAVWDWDVVTDHLVWSGEAERVLGDPALAAAWSSGAFWDRVHPDDVRPSRSAFQRALDGEDHLALELRFLRRDGRERWLAVEGGVYRDAAGLPVRMTGSAVDVTERRDAAEELRRSEERLKLAVGGAKAGLWDWDFPSKVLYYSPEWEQLLGFAPGTIEPDVETWRALVHPDDLEPVTRAMVAHLKGHTAIYETEHRLKHRDGSWIWVLDRGKVVERAPDGRAVRMTGIQTDISERKRLDAQLLVADRLSNAGLLAKGIAHEVNNPLAYVLGNLEYLLAMADTQPALNNPLVRRALTDAIEGAERVRAIVADLKTFARSEAEPPGPLDIHPVIESALRILNNEIRHQTRVRKQFAARARVMGSEGPLAQAFVNLISNAMNAMPSARSSDDNEIRVATFEDGRGAVVVEVQDNGQGMSGDVMRRIFDPFFTTRPVGEATGLGLTSCHNVVSAMGGRMEVESVLGQGSRFRVILPQAPPVEPDPGEPEPRPAGAVRRGRVLVIDDEPMVARVIEALIQADHDVVMVVSAADALARLSAGERYDAVLCDLMMPSMTGMGFFDEVRAHWPELAPRCGFVTGGAFTRAAMDFVQAMPDRCVEKPFDGPTLRQFVAALVDARG